MLIRKGHKGEGVRIWGDKGQGGGARAWVKGGKEVGWGQGLGWPRCTS